MSEAEAELNKADKLYDQGKKDEAVAVYKQKFSYSKDKATHVKRIVEFEAEQEHIAEVRKWVEIAVDAKLNVTYQNKMAQQAYATVKKDRDDAERKLQEEAVRNAKEKNAVVRMAQEKKIIPYDVLESKKIPFGLTMDILVNETATKEEVIKLAESLRQKHINTHRGISIFDSREAQHRQLDKSYPEAELSKHWLVTITRNVIDEGKLDTIRWVAEGRNYYTIDISIWYLIPSKRYYVTNFGLQSRGHVRRGRVCEYSRRPDRPASDSIRQSIVPALQRSGGQAGSA